MRGLYLAKNRFQLGVPLLLVTAVLYSLFFHPGSVNGADPKTYEVWVIRDNAAVLDKADQVVTTLKRGDKLLVLGEAEDLYLIQFNEATDKDLFIQKYSVSPKPPAIAKTDPTPPPPKSNWWSRNWGWVAGGVAVVAAGGAAGYAVYDSSRSDSDSSSAAPPPPAPSSSSSSSGGSSSSSSSSGGSSGSSSSSSSSGGYDGTYRGTATWTYTPPSGAAERLSRSLSITISGSSVTVNDHYGNPPARGTLGGNSFTASKRFTYYGKDATKTYKGTVSGNRITGSISGQSTSSAGTGYDSGSFSVSR